MKILLAIDDSKFARAAMHRTGATPWPDGSEIAVLHVVPPQSTAFGAFPQMNADTFEDIHAALREAAEQLVDEAERYLKELQPRCTITTAVREGDVRDTIVSFATECKADLIVMGSHGRTGLARLLMGSVAESVLKHAQCSVQIVRVPKEQV